MSLKNKNLIKSNPRHEGFYQDMVVVMKKYDLPEDEMLAITANFLGKLVAMQDQRKYTPLQAMEIVSRNIELGNSQMIAQLFSGAGGNA